MKTNYRSVTLNLDNDLVEALDEIRVMSRGQDIASRSEIVRWLLVRAIGDLFAGIEYDPDVSDINSNDSTTSAQHDGS